MSDKFKLPFHSKERTLGIGPCMRTEVLVTKLREGMIAASLRQARIHRRTPRSPYLPPTLMCLWRRSSATDGSLVEEDSPDVTELAAAGVG